MTLATFRKIRSAVALAFGSAFVSLVFLQFFIFKWLLLAWPLEITFSVLLPLALAKFILSGSALFSEVSPRRRQAQLWGLAFALFVCAAVLMLVLSLALFSMGLP